MVEWAPIMGIIPPLNDVEWQQAFLLYQQFPEYQLKNFNMSVEEFKSIFWFEYSHRLLGRSIGIMFLLPFLYFLFRGKIEKTLIPKLIFLFVLGGMQGLMGWYMVKSGLVNDPYVSQYRLVAHLALAVLIYAYMLWLALDLLFPKLYQKDTAELKPSKLNNKVTQLSLIIVGMIIFTLLSGGFVAGTHAGFAFNTFPLMNGQLIPDGLFTQTPLWRNLFENIITIQFNHRLLATILFIIIVVFWFKSGTLTLSPLMKTGRHLLLATVLLQLSLGISTLLLIVPVPLAAAHQAGAILLLSAAIFVSQQFHR